MRGLGKLAKGLGETALGTRFKDLVKNPAVSLPVGILSMDLLGTEVVKPMVQGLDEDLQGRRMTSGEIPWELEQASIVRREAQRQRMEDVRRGIEKSAEALKTMMPDLYRDLVHGRKFPKGAMVYGGRPRRDLLMELAESMQEGTLHQYAQRGVE